MYMVASTEQEQWAIFLAAICGQTYTQFTNTDGSFVLPLNFSLFDTIEANSLIRVSERFGFILESPEEIIIAFRGTMSSTDWITDAIASQKNFKYIKDPALTHRGFTSIYASARGQIISALKRLPVDKTLFITGHSLGGALATLCAVDVAANTDHHSPCFHLWITARRGSRFCQGLCQICSKQLSNSQPVRCRHSCTAQYLQTAETGKEILLQSRPYSLAIDLPEWVG